ncbi:uncharacterized protein K460DRAFT_372761 [Cucurbitaria berberidis CBS 394.84]|uniref:C3H1-type domain-containing protein n=1 Tax=Cucurbitaria berberidis CBS 394.84 TaxID=1168544 RepID=A0A9P4GPY1_9PLEO|nr:uncharacterized protein K460DRAFT_372761 [Cucurbitaria berberidis CBS 394.84]KAF1850533.1 hypothetical protein K460DRAFT_372761 [Cucurbitaria berberidis CBS 394.84]
MLLHEKDQDVFKRWILPKLETISDADAEVLADYVIALVVVNDSEANIKRNCLESLSDFLQDYTEPFVNDLLKALKDKSYVRAPATVPATVTPQTAPIPSIVGTSNSEYEPHPSVTTNSPLSRALKGPNAQHRLPDRPTGPSPSRDVQQDGGWQSRKRKLAEHETSQPREGHDPHYSRAGGSRPLKQPARRGGRNAHGGGLEPQFAFPGFPAMPDLSSLPPHFPPPPPGAPPFDPANPMAFFAMMAAMGSGLPGMPPLPFPNPQGIGLDQHKRKERCVDLQRKGVCSLGGICPYEHGDAIAVPADAVPEYDPEHSFLAVQPHRGVKEQGTHRGQTRGHTRGSKGGRTRAPFSLPGPSYDRSNTTLVVEQIPEDDFNEDHVRDFFLQFGTIVEIQMHGYKRLAIVKFEDRDAADRAYHNPKAVFDNRFVKVYWHKSNSVSVPPDGTFGDIDMGGPDAEQEGRLDPEEIAKRQAEAQKAFEERREKEEEAAARAEEIEKQLKEKNEEMKTIKQQLAALSGDQLGNLNGDPSQTLATLQVEAENLFALHDGTGAPRGRGRGAVRGGYRGRGYAPFPPRGRSYPPFRGGYRGRGFPATPFHAGRSSVKRLDNRPRRLAVAAIEADSPRDEALRQYLINVPGCTSIERHPEQTDTLIITFKERYQAEMFLDDSRKIPDVGILDLSWIPNNAFGGSQSTAATVSIDNDEASDDDSSATIGEQNNKASGAETEQQPGHADADMDVADDVDQWL